MKVPCNTHMFIFYLRLAFCRNLRQMGDQSECHPGNEIGQRAGCRPFTARHVGALIAGDGESSPGFRLSADHLLAPVIQRAGIRFHGDAAKTGWWIVSF